MKDFLKKYLANSCTENEFRSVLNLFTSPEKQRELEENMQEDWSTWCPQSEGTDLTPDLHKIHFEISRREHVRTGPKRLLVYLTRAAAVLFIPLSIAFLLQLQKKDPAPGIMQTISTPLASRTTFDLPDGSKVWLNSGSSVSFAADFRGERKVNLKGEAFFDVKKGSSPFLVEASGFTVKVLGTAFNVMAYYNEQPAVTLERGKILLQSVSGQQMDLQPGQQAIIDTLNQLVPIQIIPVKTLERKDMNPIERMISAGMSFTESYASIDVLFDTRQKDRFLKNTETGPDYKSIAKMMEYFIETLSEKKKKREHEVT